MFEKFKKLLLPIEVISLVVTGIGIYLTRTDALMIGMSTLAVVYFMNGFVPIDMPRSDEPGGFMDLLGSTIAPKVAWIGSAATVVGALLMILRRPGGDQQLLIGVSALGAAILILGVVVITNPHGARLFPILYRAVPVCLFGAYLMMNKSI